MGDSQESGGEQPRSGEGFTVYLLVPSHRLGGRTALQLADSGAADERQRNYGFLFALPEYERAFKQWLDLTLEGLVREKAPIFKEIPSEPVEDVRVSQVTAPSGEVVETKPFAAALPYQFFTRDFTQFDLVALAHACDSAAEVLTDKMVDHLLSMTHRITDAFANARSAEGAKFGWPLLLKALEDFPLEFDAAGQPLLPRLISNRNKRNVMPYPPMSSTEREAFDALMLRKREQFDAGRRSRTIR